MLENLLYRFLIISFQKFANIC